MAIPGQCAFSRNSVIPRPLRDDYIPNVDVVIPSYRYGANAFSRGTDMFSRCVAGSEDKMHTLYSGWLDSDVLYLAARIRAANAKGQLDQLKINSALLSRQREFEQQQASIGVHLEEFFDQILSNLAGKRVFLFTTWNVLYDFAKAGLQRGMRGVFASDSLVVSGGGAKGLVRPDDWESPVLEFTGVNRIKTCYSMSELCASHVICEHGHYHVAPWTILYVLDPDTSEVLPRTGVVTGRAAFYDLLADAHWGGFITGDEITVHWDEDCPCGARSPYIENSIIRYSEKRGGDDKISCASTPEAHAQAMEFLTNFSTAA